MSTARQLGDLSVGQVHAQPVDRVRDIGKRSVMVEGSATLNRMSAAKPCGLVNVSRRSGLANVRAKSITAAENSG